MRQMINEYINSCVLVKKRIRELTELRNALRRVGNTAEIEERDLERRIRLLYVEHGQMQEVITYLTSYMRRVEQRAKT